MFSKMTVRRICTLAAACKQLHTLCGCGCGLSVCPCRTAQVTTRGLSTRESRKRGKTAGRPALSKTALSQLSRGKPAPPLHLLCLNKECFCPLKPAVGLRWVWAGVSKATAQVSFERCRGAIPLAQSRTHAVQKSLRRQRSTCSVQTSPVFLPASITGSAGSHRTASEGNADEGRG